MRTLRTTTIPLTVLVSVLAIALSGCAPAASPSGGGSAATPAAGTTPAASAAPAHPQGKFNGVPKHCLTADDLTLSIHESLPHLNSTTMSPALNCTYYVDGSHASPVVNITYVPLGGITVAAWSAEIKAKTPTAKPIAGVGDGAFSISPSPTVPSGITFVSNGVECTAYTANFTASQKQLVILAESILEG